MPFHAPVPILRIFDEKWGAREMYVQDGFGNKLIFFRDLPKAES